MQDSQAMDVILSEEPDTHDHEELDLLVLEVGTIVDDFHGEVFPSLAFHLVFIHFGFFKFSNFLCSYSWCFIYL